MGSTRCKEKAIFILVFSIPYVLAGTVGTLSARQGNALFIARLWIRYMVNNGNRSRRYANIFTMIARLMEIQYWQRDYAFLSIPEINKGKNLAAEKAMHDETGNTIFGPRRRRQSVPPCLTSPAPSRNNLRVTPSEPQSTALPRWADVSVRCIASCGNPFF